MDNSGAAHQGQQSLQPQQQSALIRAEQVKKLPHIQDAQKGNYERVVQKLWDTLNSQPQNSDNWTKAYGQLSQISKQLMAGMRQWQASARQQQAANAAAQAGAGGASNAAQQAGNITTFAQLNPAIQARVNSYTIVYPPTVKQGTPQANDWLSEAKLRFGQALQRMEIGKAKIAELQKLYQTRNNAGQPFQQHEMEQYTAKMNAYRKTVNESNSFLEKFKVQQNQFRSDQQAQQQQQQNAPAPSTGPQLEGAVDTGAGSQNVAANGQGPAAHTISSAVNAARSQANAAQAAMSPTTQTSPTAPQITGSTPGQPPPPTSTAVAQSPYNATSGQADLSGTAQAAIQQQQQQNQQHVANQQAVSGPPRPLSQSATIQQAAQNYSTTNQAQGAIQPPQSATTVHGHPPYMQQGSFMKKDERMKISPNLNTKPHEPVQMAPARPTLTGGPSVGAIGQMGQPAIPKMPGYVLEGAGNERVLSKNKLNELVREITGAGPEDGDQLSPEAEEILLSLADDFVDTLISTACRLAKLRGQSALDIRDIQVILERQYNIRIPGYATDEIRTIKRVHPTVEYLQKMGAVGAAKVTGSGTVAGSGTAGTAKGSD